MRRAARQAARQAAVGWLAAAALATGGLAGRASAQDAGGATFRGDAARSGRYEASGPAHGVVESWRFQAPGTVRSSPAVTAERVYVGSGDGSLFALDRATGRELWRYDAGDPVTSSPAVSDGVVVITTRNGGVHAVSTSGDRLWSAAPTSQLPLPWGREGWDYYASSPLILDGRTVVATPDGMVRSLDLRTGRERWRYEAGARIRSSPAAASGVNGGLVVVGDDAGVVHGLRLRDGTRAWRHATEGAGHDSEAFGFDRTSVQASPAIAGRRVFVGSRDGGLYALDLGSGERLWRVDYGSPWVISSAAVGGGRVYIASSDGHFVQAVEAATGAEVWRTDVGARVFASPALADDALYVGDHAGRVLALDPETGLKRWSLGLANQIQASPVPAGSALFVGTDAGWVHALDAAPSPARRAVFWDSTVAGFATTPGSSLLRDYLADHGYEVVDAASLPTWIAGRADRSVIVFAIDHLPAAVGAEDGGGGALLRYLEAGGKVVWTGFPPWAIVRDSTGRPVSLDLERHRVLGIDLSGGPTGDYGAVPTAEGRRWGLDGLRLSAAVIRPTAGVIALARDETGRIAAAVRSFGGRPGSGLVVLWGRGATWKTLADIRAVADHGIVRRP